ncbi:MAG: hypothetical protein ACRCY3_16020 [Sphingorhabdus sp.]
MNAQTFEVNPFKALIVAIFLAAFGVVLMIIGPDQVGGAGGWVVVAIGVLMIAFGLWSALPVFNGSHNVAIDDIGLTRGPLHIKWSDVTKTHLTTVNRVPSRIDIDALGKTHPILIANLKKHGELVAAIERYTGTQSGS